MRKPTPLKLAIVASGVPQREIAGRVGIDEAQMSRIVNGLHCDEPLRRQIAEAVGRPIEELWPELHGAAVNDTTGASDGPGGRQAA